MMRAVKILREATLSREGMRVRSFLKRSVHDKDRTRKTCGSKDNGKMMAVIEYKCQHSATFFVAQHKLMLICVAHNYTRHARFHTLSF